MVSSSGRSVVSDRVIGIDFGTSTSLAAEGAAGRGVTLAPLGRSTTYMPSLIGVTPSQLLAGDVAADLPEQQIVRSIKRQITERRSKISHPLAPDRSIDVDAVITQLLRELASSARGVGIDLDGGSVRLGCPAMWDGEQRMRLIRLAQAAGIPVSEHTLVDEPIAAGMAWLTNRRREHNETVTGRLLVFDMGGGTLDVALLQVDTAGGDNGEISVLASKGVNEAGDALDLAIRDDLMTMIDRHDLGLDDEELADVRRQALPEARQAKLMLSTAESVKIQIQLGSHGSHEHAADRGVEPRRLWRRRRLPQRLPVLTYSRRQLEDAFGRQLDAAEALTWHVVRESFLTHEVHRSPAELRAIPNEVIAAGVDRVLLAGGMSRIPAIASRLRSMFPHAVIYNDAGRRVGADEAIVAGLAETTAYDRVNLHRPSFNFSLDLPDGEIQLYDAYSPLYESWLASQRSVLYYEKHVDGRSLPRSGVVHLRARSPLGETVTFQFGNADRPGIPFDLGHKGIRFRIRPNGYISITDGKGRTHNFRVNRWPVLRGRDHAAIEIERVEKSEQMRLPARSWERDPLFLH